MLVTCERCREPFKPRWRNPRFCSAECREALRRPLAPEPNPVEGARWVPLTYGRFALVDEADYSRVAERAWYLDHGYARTRDEFLHRFILGLKEGDPEVDHRNRDRLDNRRENLRPSTRAGNCANKGKASGRSSRFKGVHWMKKGHGRWVAAIKHRQRSIHIGQFLNEEDAARAYDAKALELFGEFASVNFPQVPAQ